MTAATLMILTRPSTISTRSSAAAGPGFEQADPSEAQLDVTDLGVTRGDGIFESVSIVHDRPQALEAHLTRLAHSAGLMDLPEPDLDVWRSAVLAAAQAHRTATGDLAERYAKLVMTRGVEGLDRPTAWVYVDAVPDFSAARTTGIRVVTLDRGYRHDVPLTSPWLLQGAKTLSYAINRAALREANRRGGDDVIFLSSDGFVLEGPNSSVVLRHGDAVRTPATDQGILAGTTQASVFEFFAAEGYTTSYERIPADELAQADALWLVSSLRQAAPVRMLDGAELAVDTELAVSVNRHLLGRSE